MSHITRGISEIARYGMQYRTERMKALGLNGSHPNYLVEICADPGISQNRLAQRLCFNKSNVARQVAFLEENGFVTCTPSPKDKRVTKLYPTEKTLALLPQISAMLDAWEKHLTQDLSPEDKAALAALLARLKERAGTWTEVDPCAEA